MSLTTSCWRRVVAVVAVGILAFVATPSTAASAAGSYGLIKSDLAPEWCLSTNLTPYPGFPSNTAAVYTTVCNPSIDYRLWDVGSMSGTDSWQVENKQTGKCLSMNLQPAPGGNTNTRAAYTVACNTSDYQQWFWGTDNKIRNLATGWCLSACRR